ncbi:hypothetical protein PLESTB_000910600 [Pleodorina starrii]|uniref:Protein TIC 40, chloroplastic n=1 Tax=Pleodorina starrii TaxID=330485 RepID=A0A9W6BP03_9CHLO|nr:hypothetical protein PLESTM_001522100 [Pleodorina starrii]GLC54831.1 hypothetical protein PLESTB_000910600 [Pleodorina starrii]GLC73722.1 hypothetical protein PLESTF_001412100 [Pleodorina starrii]
MLCTRSSVAPRGIGRVSPLAPRPAGSLRVRCQATPGGEQQQSIAPIGEVAAPPVAVPVQPAPIPETTATYVMPPNPVYYQGMPAQRQDYYMTAPPAAYYPPAPAPYKEEAPSSGAPWWIWLGLGVILGQVLAKVQEFMKNPKTPQQIMMEMAMKQMSGAMGGAPGAGMPPFGGPASPFGAAPGAAANPFANFAAAAAASQPPVDTTASAVQGAASTSAAQGSSSNGEARKGEKFASRLSSEGREPRKPEAPQAASTPLDVVEPVVKEPSPSSSSSGANGGAGASKPRSSFFADVDAEATTASTSASSSGAAGAPGADGPSTAVMSEMMESMLRNPEMQKMLYPYLPEPMRNPQSIEWMLSNPEVKKQMEQMFTQQNVMSPQMMDMMKNMDFNQDKVNRQFAELGLKPEDVISKVMANPELAAGFSNPKVQAAIIDISSNPMNIMKYQTDPEIMKVLEKVTEIFQPQMNQK